MSEIMQADREAAWPFRPSCYTRHDYARWIGGAYDGVEPIIAFARHRIAGFKEAQEAAVKVANDRAAICADAVAKIEAGELYGGADDARATENCARLEAAHIAKLIANLSPSTTGGSTNG